LAATLGFAGTALALGLPVGFGAFPVTEAFTALFLVEVVLRGAGAAFTAAGFLTPASATFLLGVRVLADAFNAVPGLVLPLLLEVAGAARGVFAGAFLVVLALGIGREVGFLTGTVDALAVAAIFLEGGLVFSLAESAPALEASLTLPDGPLGRLNVPFSVP